MSNEAQPRHTTVALLSEFSIPLILGVLAALIWANVAPHGYHEIVHTPIWGTSHLTSLHFLVNDIFMAFFFGIAAKEITESCLPGGALNPPRKALNPLLGTIGGIAGPALVYAGWCLATGDRDILRGWGIPTATDIAMAWLVARIIFGPRHAAVSFLLLLAIADDGIGLVIIAVFYPDPAHPIAPAYLGLVALAVAIAWYLRRKRVYNFWAYLALPGVLSWFGFFLAHLHPALGLVPIVPFMPAADHDEGLFAETSAGPTHDTLNHFEHTFKLPVDFGLFAFGLSNAGVTLSSVGNATYAVLVALLLGKMLGIFSFSMLAHRMGFSLPSGMTPASLLVAAMIAGIGLTVALFVAGVAFTDPALQGAAKMGALLSVSAAPIAIAIGRALGLPAPPAASTNTHVTQLTQEHG